MYESNYTILKQMVAEGAVLWPPERHRNAAGEYNLAENMAIWNRAVARMASIPLWEQGAPGFDPERDPLQIQPNLVFIPAQGADAPRGTVIIAHGGAFVCHAGHEGFHTALRFAEAGFNTAVLTYRLKPYSRRDAMADMSRAIRLLRARRAELGITGQIAVLGFSAGGMLSGNCATHYDRGDPDAADPIERCSSRPDAAVICYGAFATVAFPEGFLQAPLRRGGPRGKALSRAGKERHAGHAALFHLADHQRRSPQRLCAGQRADRGGRALRPALL